MATIIETSTTPATKVPVDPVNKLGLRPGAYATLVSRPTPENSVREIVAGAVAHQRI